ncbi:MAG TPA: class I SAM-dependent methyltransferase [Acidimicrobiales bacterium]|nr:class I SAM-dependent methyltransferase [Acidimicrobiales bacterium]
MALRDRIFAALYDRVLAPMEEAGLRAWRADLLADLSGTVVEVGAGTGANLAHYPPAVERLVVTEPEPAMLAQMRDRLGTVRPGVPVEVRRAASASLPLADGEADAVVSTLVLCSVPDPAATLAELRRVLRPGGRLVFMEHVAADHRPSRLRWQRRFDHVWPFLCGGCHLTRRTAEAIEEAGFTLEDVQRESARKASPLVRTMVRGTAVAPA